MKNSIILCALLSAASFHVAGHAQDLKSGPYELPYKNTYVKNVFVAENEFRTAEPVTLLPGSFEEAEAILPSPVWKGHEAELDM